jgi:uncharacterized protein
MGWGDPLAGQARILFGADTILAELAESEAERARGLMGRSELAEGRGLLFVFANSDYRDFWMRNTPIALDIAFLDATLRVVDIQTMEPCSDRIWRSRAPALYALEVRGGWFDDRGIQVGAQASLEFLRPEPRAPLVPEPPPGLSCESRSYRPRSGSSAAAQPSRLGAAP